jgi:hypothetical protein
VKKCFILALLCLGASPANARKEPPLTYDYQGDIRWVVVQHDEVSSMTHSDGTTTTVHCDFTGSVSACGEGSGASQRIRFDEKDISVKNQEIMCCVVAFGWPKLKECSDWVNRKSLYDCDPLKELGSKLPYGNNDATLTFRYRTVNLISFGDKKHPEPGFCVPFEITDRKGRIKQGETCYRR